MLYLARSDYFAGTTSGPDCYDSVQVGTPGMALSDSDFPSGVMFNGKFCERNFLKRSPKKDCLHQAMGRCRIACVPLFLHLSFPLHCLLLSLVSHVPADYTALSDRLDVVGRRSPDPTTNVRIGVRLFLRQVLFATHWDSLLGPYHPRKFRQ